jgi:hypothetical protein
MGGRAAGFRPAVAGGVGRLSPGSDWLTDFPDFGRTALRSPMNARHSLARSHVLNPTFIKAGSGEQWKLQLCGGETYTKYKYLAVRIERARLSWRRK